MQSSDIGPLPEQRSLLDKLQKQAGSNKIPVIGTNTGYFLKLAIMLVRPVSILEIGCGIGFSTYFIMEALGTASSYTGIDMNKDRLDNARTFIGERFPDLNHKFINGNALNLIPGLDDIYDFVFIDAAKFEYPLYLKALIGKIKKGTIIIADDIFCKGWFFADTPSRHFKNSVKGIKMYLESVNGQKGFDTAIMDIDNGLSVSMYRGAGSEK